MRFDKSVTLFFFFFVFFLSDALPACSFALWLKRGGADITTASHVVSETPPTIHLAKTTFICEAAGVCICASYSTLKLLLNKYYPCRTCRCSILLKYDSTFLLFVQTRQQIVDPTLWCYGVFSTIPFYCAITVCSLI